MSKKQEEMSFLEHLDALRWHLMRSVVAILVFSLVAFMNKEILFDQIIFGPMKSHFITFVWLCEASGILNEIVPMLISKETLCIGKDFPSLQNITMSGQFMTHMWIAFISGLILAIPYVFWELWRFIKPALQEKEQKYVNGVVFITSFLFLAGVLFGYFIIAPLSINFFFNYQISESVINMPTLDTYISLMTTIILACGVVFELPILVYFLTKLGVLTPQFMRTYRKHAVIVMLIVAAVITPPDVFSQLLVMVPLLFLYELSILISTYVVKKNEI